MAHATSVGQRSLFGREPPRCDLSFRSVERIDLADSAWLELARGWLSGHEQLFDELAHTTPWLAEERTMYDRRVEVPRLHASIPEGARRHPLLERMRQALNARYATDFERLTVALYRDGRDSVAWHGDYVARRLPEAIVATVSIGAPRRFLIRPTTGGTSQTYMLGWGDLLVMGGACQRTHQHCIPKVASAAPRIAIMFRPAWQE